MISERIKEVREKNGLNKKEMSTRLGIPYTTYNNYETGSREPGSDFLLKFSYEFGISIDYIMGNNKNGQDISYEYKKNDTIADIILKLRSDNDFLKIVSNIYSLPKEQLGALNAFLAVLQQQNIN